MICLLPTRRHPWVTPALVVLLAVAVVPIAEYRRSKQARVDQQSATSNDVTAALRLLLRSTDVEPEVFTCPATQPTRWDFGGENSKLNWSNWSTAGTHATTTLRYQSPSDTER